MIDANELLRAWILSSGAVTTLVGTGNANEGVYCGDLPEKFDPKLGPGVQIRREGGLGSSEIPGLIDARMRVRVWADVEEYDVASQVYGAIYDLIHGSTDLTNDFGTVVRCIEITSPQDLTDPDTGWSTVIGFFSLMAHS